MSDPDAIRDYRAPDDRPAIVERTAPHLAIARFPDELPAIGEAVEVRADDAPDAEAVVGEVRRHPGRRRVELLFFAAPDWLEAGCPARRLEHPAALRAPDSGRIDLDDLALAAKGPGTVSLGAVRPPFAELDGERPALPVGHDGVDLVAPIATRGVDLVIDESDGDDAFAALAARVIEATDPDAIVATTSIELDTGAAPHTYVIEIQDGVGAAGATLERALALRAARCLGCWRRDAGDTTLVIADLPALAPGPDTGWLDPAHTTGRGPGEEADPPPGMRIDEVVDRMGDALVSTTEAPVTLLLRLPAAGTTLGTAEILETLALGDVDAQIVIDARGRFAPERSMSRATHGGEEAEGGVDASRRRRALADLAAARELEDRAEIFGAEMLEDAERALLERVEELRAPLV
jgi:hypothetical protein